MLAKNSQQEIISELESEQVNYQSFWVVNALRVNGNESLVQKLAERDDVKNILDNSAMGLAKPEELIKILDSLLKDKG